MCMPPEPPGMPMPAAVLFIAREATALRLAETMPSALRSSRCGLAPSCSFRMAARS